MINPTEIVRTALEEEPVRIAASFALVAVAALSLAGVTLPPVAVALAGMVLAELARRKTVPLVRAEDRYATGYSDGHYRGCVATLRSVTEANAALRALEEDGTP